MTPLTLEEKERVLARLEASLEPKVFETWCRSLTFEALEGGSVRVPTANPVHRDWLEKLLKKPIEDAFLEVFGRVPDLVFQVGHYVAPPPLEASEARETAPPSAAAAPARPAP